MPFVDYNKLKRTTKRKGPNPKGSPLRVRTDCELAIFINSILANGNGFDDQPITLKELAKFTNIHYQNLWSAYNQYRKLSIEDMIALHGFADINTARSEADSRLSALAMYLNQKPPTRGLPDLGGDTDPNAPVEATPNTPKPTKKAIAKKGADPMALFNEQIEIERKKQS